MQVAGTAVPFISPEDLIATKILAGRTKDIEDIRGILLERGRVLDIDRIAATLRILETGLERSDLVRVLEAELTRWRDERQ